MSYYNDYQNVYPYFKINHDIKKSSKLKLEGIGNMKIKPNLAVAFIGIVSENKQLPLAQEENAEVTKKVISALSSLGIEDKDIKTENFLITPEYDYIEGKQSFRSYKVNNNLRITVRDIQQVGEVIDTAIAKGANVVYNVNFGLSNKEEIYNKALSLAIRNAVDKALSVEKTLNINVNIIPTEIIEESSEPIIPLTKLYSIETPSAETKIKNGEIVITAKITAIFNYNEI